MNTTNENENKVENPSASSALIPSSSGTRPPRGRPLSRLLCLSERQLEHVNDLLKEGVPYREIVKFCRDNFNKEIPRMTFFRYANRLELARELHLDQIADAKEAAAEFSKYAVTGDPSFSTNTLALLEEQAFDLALAHHRDGDAEDLSTLKKLWDLIHKAKSTNIRERHATVQERKCDLRAKELELKRDLAASRLSSNPVAAEVTRLTSSSRDAASQTNAAEADQNPTPKSNPVNLVNPVQNSALSTLNSQPSPDKKPLLVVSPNPLPPEIVEENRRYAEKLRTGKIIFDESGPYIRDIELPDDPDTTPSPVPSSTQPSTPPAPPSATANA